MHSLPGKLTLTLIIFLFAPYRHLLLAQSAENVKDDSIAVAKTINEFVDAFSNLKWEEFTECFAEDATAFFPPSAHHPARTNNKQEILTIFKRVFENAQKQKNPHITINPEEMKIQMLAGVAIVTFQLNDPDLFGRRTIVLKKEKEKWRIIHLHASGIKEETN